jgi:hypothetical protein
MFATSAASQYQQSQAAEAKAEQQTKLYDQNRKNSYKALAQEYGDIGARQSQEQAASAERKEEIARQERAERASAIVRAGEAGVSGTSVSLGLGDVSGAAARDRSTVTRNLEWTMGQLQRRKASAQTGTINRINSMQKGSAPSKSALGIGIANSAASSYMNYESTKPKSTKPKS